MPFKALTRILLIAACTLAGTVHAQDTPTQLTGGKVITVQDAKQLLDGKKAAFIDTRSVINFGKGHVPSAVTASYKEKSDKVAEFDASKDANSTCPSCPPTRPKRWCSTAMAPRDGSRTRPPCWP